MIRKATLYLVGIFFLVAEGSQAKKANGIISITIYLKESAKLSFVRTARLAYNKSFAFSFTLDDGLISDYLVALPFLGGGYVSRPYIDRWGNDQGGDGRFYPGLFYTDGCGNNIPFRAAVAVNAKTINAAAVTQHPGFLSWAQLKALQKAGWDILNHSYSHATGKHIDADYEIRENNRMVNKHLGMLMEDFVIPGGHNDIFSNKIYTEAAFALGMKTVQCEDFGDFWINIWPKLNLGHLMLGRLFIHTVTDTTGSTIKNKLTLSSDGTLPYLSEDSLLATIDSHLGYKQAFWINAFTHGVGNQNVWNISLIFPEFKQFFSKLELRYGQKGVDNIWMAPTREVYEYLLNRRLVKYTVEKRKKKIVISIDRSTLLSDSRYHILTFIITGKNAINKVLCRGCYVESYSRNTSNGVININWR